jgi:hypothetical protein
MWVRCGAIPTGGNLASAWKIPSFGGSLPTARRNWINASTTYLLVYVEEGG